MSEAVSRDAAAADQSAPATPADATSAPGGAVTGVTGEPGLEPSLADLIVASGLAVRRFEVPAGTALYEPEDLADNLYLVHAGQVRVLLLTPGSKQRAVRLLEILGPGDWLGAPALSGDRTYDTRAVAFTNVTASQVPVGPLLATLPQHPAVAGPLIRSLAGKLRSAYTQAANLVFDDTNRRLVKTLLQFSQSAAATPLPGPAGEAGVELRITHQQLAQAIGAARETVSLALTQLRQKKLLQTGRNRLSFNPDALAGFYQSQGGKSEDPAPTPEPAADGEPD